MSHAPPLKRFGQSRWREWADEFDPTYLDTSKQMKDNHERDSLGEEFATGGKSRETLKWRG